jgi:hypothetical protein
MTKLTHGNVSYDIKATTQSNAELGEDNRGRIWYEKLAIWVDKELPDELKLQTLYHEIAHAMCEQTSFNGMLMDKLGEHGYEIFIDNLGKVLYDIVKKNNMKAIEKEILEIGE